MRIDFDLNPEQAAMKIALLDDNKIEVTSACARFDEAGMWKDSYGDFFTKDTDFSLEFPARIGVYVDHGFNTLFEANKVTVAELFLGSDDIGEGVFHKAILDKSITAQALLAEKIEAGEIGASTGAVSHLVRYQYMKDFNAWKILNWALGELSYTTVKSADSRNVVQTAKFADNQIVSFNQRYSAKEVVEEIENKDYSSGNALLNDVLTLIGQ